MTTHDRPPRYHAFLLRCWEERSQQPDAPSIWRFSLEDPHIGEKHGFATLEALIAAVRHELDAANDSVGDSQS